MTSDLFRKPAVPLEPKPNKYERFGLTRNPFPAKPSVIINSPDPVENGSIYLPELRENEQSRFEQLLIPNPDRPQVRPIAFLMDYATRRGRGIGKTAFLYHQCKRIMRDLGDELSGSTQVIFAAYVLPPAGGKYRRFWQLSKMLTDALVTQEIIAKAMWRLRAFSGVIPDEVLSQVGTEPQKTIGSNNWLETQGVPVMWDLDHSIRMQLEGLGIRDDLVNALKNFGHSVADFRRYYFDNLSDYYWRRDEGQLLFDDLVKVFTAAGFTKGLLLVDEMEKIIPYQNTEERRAFTEALRYFFIDGQCENARLAFYGLLLTIHPYLQELLNPHWEASGLDRFAALSRELAAEYTVYFEPLTEGTAIPLAKAYLDESRISDDQKGSLEPFDANALEEALMLTGRVPGRFLTLLNNSIEKAVQKEWQIIGADQIRIVAQARAPKEPDQNDAVETLPPSQVNLLKGSE
jgi:hypothetical protein